MSHGVSIKMYKCMQGNVQCIKYCTHWLKQEVEYVRVYPVELLFIQKGCTNVVKLRTRPEDIVSTRRLQILHSDFKLEVLIGKYILQSCRGSRSELYEYIVYSLLFIKMFHILLLTKRYNTLGRVDRTLPCVASKHEYVSEI